MSLTPTFTIEPRRIVDGTYSYLLNLVTRIGA